MVMRVHLHSSRLINRFLFAMTLDCQKRPFSRTHVFQQYGVRLSFQEGL